MTDYQNVVADGLGGIGDFLHLANGIVQGHGGFRPYVATGGQSHVSDHDVGAGCGHPFGLFDVEYVGRGEQIEVPSRLDQVDFQTVAHAGFLQVGAHLAIEKTYGGKILNASESHVFQLSQKVIPQHEGVGAIHAGEHGSVVHCSQYFAGHFQHDLVGVAVGHQAGERASSSHAVSSGIVDHDEVDAAGLFAFGRYAGAGPAPDNGLACGYFGAEAIKNGGT